MTTITTLDSVAKIYALDREQAVINLRQLLGTDEAPPIALAQASPKGRRLLTLFGGLIAAALLIAAGLERNEYLEAQARSEFLKAQTKSEQLLALVRSEHLRALARTEISDLTSWDNTAQVLLADETSPSLRNEAPSLRTPEEILTLHQEFLARRSGPGWQDVSPAQAENIKAIAMTYVAGFMALRQVPELESLLYGRGGAPFAANLTAKDVWKRLNAGSKILAAIEKTQTAWGPLPTNAPREHVARIFDLAGSRVTLLEAELSVLHYLADNPRAWTLVQRGDVHMPVFSKPALQAGFTQLLDTEARDDTALLQALSQLVGPALAQQLKAPCDTASCRGVATAGAMSTQ
jgi:hypothetical protein